MSFIQNMMEKQNNVFILIKKNINPEFNNKEILGVYSSQEIALKEKQKHSLKIQRDNKKVSRYNSHELKTH